MNPVAELHSQFSSPDATATSWEQARTQLEEAKIYWLSTVRPDGRPHVTPLFGVWLESAWYFCTGAGERKAKNLVHSPYCTITTGCNVIEGLDVIMEGEALQVNDEAKLQRMANAYLAKYGWQFTVQKGALYGEGGRAEAYEVTPVTAFGFGKGELFSQTRWRF